MPMRRERQDVDEGLGNGVPGTGPGKRSSLRFASTNW